MTEQLSKESKVWQSLKVMDAKLTPRESQELTDFLNRRSTAAAQETKPGDNDEVSFQDVQELLAWLKERMALANINDMERKQLNDWLITLLTRSPALNRQELEEIKHTLSEQLIPAFRTTLTPERVPPSVR
jgi:hypothetical protein